MSQPHVFQRLMAATIMAAFLTPFTAQAGFEWKGPATAPVIAVPNAPAAAADSAYPEPVIMWQDNGVAPAPNGAGAYASMPAEKIGTVESSPVLPPPPPAAVELAPSSASLAPNLPVPVMDQANEGDVVDGFGSDLPLAIALQQIVPAGHQFSFGAGVNPGISVSWEGGKPWKTVLSETLFAKNLNYVIEGNVVKVIEQRDMMPMAGPNNPPSLPNVTGIEQMPATTAQGADALAIMKAPTDPVDIRRQKPTSLLQKMKNLGHRMSPDDKATIEAQEKEKAAAEKSGEKKAVQKTETKTVVTETVTQAAPAAPEVKSNDVVWSNAPQTNNEMPLSITRSDAPSQGMSTAPEAMTVQPVQAVPPVTSGVTMSADTAPAGVMASATWHGARGQTLRDVLKSWSDVAGVELYWSIDYDFRLQNDVGYPGSYDEAVGHLLDTFAGTRPQPYGQLHQDNGNGARVLVIKSYDTAG